MTPLEEILLEMPVYQYKQGIGMLFTDTQVLEAMKEAYELGFATYKKDLLLKLSDALNRNSNTGITASDIVYLINNLQP